MHIACLLSDDFEDSEFRAPYDAFRDAGHDVTIIGAAEGKKLRGKKGVEEVYTNKGIDEVRPEHFDALFIPGGGSPDRLRADDRFVGFTRAFSRKPVFAICHGPQLLITADMVRGREMTAWKTVQVDLVNAGARVSDVDVVVDEDWVTSRQPTDIPAFIREALQVLVRHDGVASAGGVQHAAS